MELRHWSATALAVALPAAVAAAALPLRATVVAADVAAVLVGVVAVAGATLGTRATPVLAAASAALAFDLLWARPYGTVAVRAPGDLATGAVLLVVGATLAELGRRRRPHARRRLRQPMWRPRRVVEAEHLATVGQVAAGIADGDDAGLVVLDVARALVGVLDLRDCSFERAPFDRGDRAVLRHTGELELRGVRWDPAVITPPARGFHIPVAARGRVVGRYLCVPRRTVPVRRGSVVVALTLVDQAASALVLAPTA
jgi:hypothetical protein